MSLKTITQKVRARTGTNESPYLTRLINDAAEELYRADDLVGANKELLVKIPSIGTKIMAFPHYVHEIRGLRYYYSMVTIKQNMVEGRYANDNAGIKLDNWRDLGTSPLMVQITNASTLTFSIPMVESEDIVISVVGSTPNSSRLEEKVTIKAGNLSVETSANFDKVQSLTKLAPNTYNITVTDAEDTELTIIPNNEICSCYKIIQIRDDKFTGQLENSGIEVLYKEKFVPLVNDSDTFLDGRYDDAIYWKFLEAWYSTQDGKGQESLMCHAKSDEIVKQIARDCNTAKDLSMQFAPCQYYNMFGQSWAQY
jgi:hypothetical protein